MMSPGGGGACFAFGAKLILLRGLMKASLTPFQSTAEVVSDSKMMTDGCTAKSIHCLLGEWTREVLYARTVMAVSNARHGMDIVKHDSNW